jgi:uncharacterized protein YkwD
MNRNIIRTVVAAILNLVCLLSILTVQVFASDRDTARQVLAEMNLARTQPKIYAGYLKEMRRNFQGKLYRMPGSNVLLQTSEGVAAVDEAIRFLTRQKPLPALGWSNGLAAAAAELVTEQSRSGGTGHTGAESGSMRERIERHGTWDGRIGENIAYGPFDARLLVIQLIVDDGVSGRGHRKNHFSPAFGTAGVACGPHPDFEGMCVIDFAGSFSQR